MDAPERSAHKRSGANRDAASDDTRQASRLLLTFVAALAAAAVVLRVAKLANIPGLNGDEAWSGIQAMGAIRGSLPSLTTPTGNPLNPFFLLPTLVLHAIFEPGVALLRIVPLVSGIAALVVNYFLCRRAFDVRTAVISTLALAVLPINIAYSRLAWDASQSVLATLPVMLLPLAAMRSHGAGGVRLVMPLAAFAAALIVHPTNIFTAPLVALPLAYAIVAARWPNARSWLPKACWVIVGVAISTIVVWAIIAGGGLTGAVSKLERFAVLYAQFLSGTTAYRYISGATASGDGGAMEIPALGIDGCFASLVAMAAYGFARRLREDNSAEDRALVAAWAGVVAGFFVVAGAKALQPGLERYAMCLVAPSVLLLARGLGWWTALAGRAGQWATWLLLTCGWLTLAVFAVNYFAFVVATGGRAHLTFRTASIEPKVAAYRYVIEHSPASGPITIYTDEWWLHKPLEYFATSEPRIRVETDSPDARGWWSDRADGNGKTWFIRFAADIPPAPPP